jgi:uridine kinase
MRLMMAHRPPTRDDGSMPTPQCVPEIARRVLAGDPRCGATRLVCIDGPAGSGKTTLAGALAAALDGAPVVHMDDLYQGWAQELGEALAHRVEAWLLLGWESGLPGIHPRYDWVLGRYAEWVTVPPAPVVVLEGCASGSSLIRARATLVAWVEAPADVRLQRGVERDGVLLEAQWRAWQSHERAHFAADATRAAADVVVDGISGRISR